MNGWTVREASLGDTAAMAALSGQLGYPTAPDDMGRRVRAITLDPHHLICVAQSDAGEILGWIHAYEIQILESGHRVEIAGMVVDERSRRKGIGRLLVAAIEAWAAGRSVSVVSVRCNVKRAETHEFYEGLGYESVKTQKVFRKQLKA